MPLPFYSIRHLPGMKADSMTVAFVEEWKRMCCEFSLGSEDILLPVLMKLLDALTFALKNADKARIQLALASLEHERSLSLKAEPTRSLPIRTLMYGVIQCTHGVLMNMNDSTIASTKNALTTVEYWKRKCHKFATQSADIMYPVVAKVFDAIAVILADSGRLRIRRALAAVESQRAACQSAESGTPSIRSMMYGVIQCVHATLQEKKVASHVISAEDVQRFEIQSLLVPKEEPIDSPPQYYGSNNVDENKTPLRRASKRTIHDADADAEPSPKRLRSSTTKNRLMATPNKNNLRETRDDSSPSAETPGAMLRSHNRLMATPNKSCYTSRTAGPKSAVKLNPTELKCPKCEYRTASVQGWRSHLKGSHSITPTQAGFMLRCECGNESYSEQHSRFCDISRITVVPSRGTATRTPRKRSL